MWTLGPEAGNPGFGPLELTGCVALGKLLYFSELVILCAIETISYVGALEMLAPSFPPGERNLFCPRGPAQDGIKHLLDML